MLQNEHLRSVAVQVLTEPGSCQGLMNLNCVQMWESGCKLQYRFFWVQ